MARAYSACVQLVEKGNLAKPLLIQNRTRGRADKLAEALGDKVEVVESVQDAVSRSDIVFTCLGEPRDSSINKDALNIGIFRQAMTLPYRTFSKRPSLAMSKASSSSSVAPFLPTRRMAWRSFAASMELPSSRRLSVRRPTGHGHLHRKRRADQLSYFLYAVGAPAVADAGQLLFVLAGSRAAVERVIPYTTGVMGKAYLHVSEDDFGKASKLKLIGNVSRLNRLANGTAMLMLSAFCSR